MSLFRKALSVFIVMDDAPTAPAPTQEATNQPQTSQQPQPTNTSVTQADLGKFVQHFEQLFEQTNLPGPDYYEFWKMLDTLEAHIPDESARIQAVYATLSIQGLNKVTLLDTASKYKDVILSDKASFEAAAKQKADIEIAGRRATIQNLEAEAANKSKQIAQLQQELEAAAAKTAQLQQEMADEETKINSSKQGYLAACGAMIAKIDQDIQRFKNLIA